MRIILTKIQEFIKTTYLNNKFKDNLDYSIWIFSSSYNNTFDYNSKYLFEYVLENEKKVTPIFVINDDRLRKKLKNQYGNQYFINSKSKEGKKTIIKSGVWLFSAGLPLYGTRLNKNRLVINLWHGVPLKKIGLEENNITFLRRSYFKTVFSRNYTHILTTSKSLTGIMANSFGVKKEVIYTWGQPRNDELFKESNQKNLNNIFPNLPDFSKIILYAPTFRDTTPTKFFPFEDFELYKFNEFLKENNIIFFIRSHRFEKTKVDEYLGDRIKLINGDKVEDIMEVLNVFDLLITDYSSIYIDYLLTQKPVMFLPYDKNEYLEERGMNFEYDEVTPGPKPDNIVDFQNEILKLLNDNKYYQKERKKVNQIFNEINYPCSEEIINNIKEIIKNKYRKSI